MHAEDKDEVKDKDEDEALDEDEAKDEYVMDLFKKCVSSKLQA